MSQLLIILFSIFLLLNVGEVNATTYASKPRHEIVKKSEFIGKIEVTGGKAVEISLDKKLIGCGGVYTARVTDNLIGDTGVIEFYSDERMKIGRSYLIFLTRKDTAGFNLTSTNSMMFPMLREQAAMRTACGATYDGLKAIEGFTSEFNSYRAVVIDGESIDEQWIEYSGFANDQKGDISVFSFEAENILVKTNDTSKTLTLDELVNDQAGVESAYPLVWMEQKLMRWSDVRAAILAELETLKHNKSLNADASDAGAG